MRRQAPRVGVTDCTSLATRASTQKDAPFMLGVSGEEPIA